MNQYNEILPNQQYIDQRPILPFNTIAAVGASKQRQHDENEAQRQELLGKSWNALSQDIPRTQALKKEIGDHLEEFANKDFTDPSVRADWYKTKRDILNKFSPTGEVGAIQGNYDLHSKYMDELQKLRDKGPKEGGIDSESYQKLANRSLNDYKGIGELGVSGYNRFSGMTPASFSDISHDANELANGWKENAVKSGAYQETSDGKFMKKTTRGWEEVKPDEIYQNILPELLNNPMHRAFANQQGLLNTQDPEQASKYAQNLFHVAARAAANKYGYRKTEYDESLTADPGYDKDASKGQFTLYNESVLVPGEKQDFTGLSNRVSDIKNQLNQLPKEGSPNDNYLIKGQRDALNMKLKTSQNYLNDATSKYYDSESGKKELNSLYNRVTSSDFKNVNQSLVNREDYKEATKSPEKFIEFMKNGDGEFKSSLEYMTGITNKVSDYIDQNPISYSAKVLTGGKTSTVGKMNEELTKRVVDNGTNYYTPDGVDLNTYINKHIDLSKGETVSVAMMDNDIHGQFAHYMTIKDKDGKTKAEIPIYPKDGGRQEQGYLGKKLIQENKSSNDPLSQENYERGKRMLANAKYGEALSDEYIDSFKHLATDGKSGRAPISLNIYGTPFTGYVKITKENGIFEYNLINENGQSVMKNNKGVKSLDDLRVALIHPSEEK